MAYCHGPDSPYGCGHHDEHVDAAHKGWATRRRNEGAGVARGPTVRQELRGEGAKFLPKEAHDLASAFLGERVRNAHVHPSHKGRVLFQSRGKWYELPTREFNSFVRGGRTANYERNEQRRKAEAGSVQEKLYQQVQANAVRREQYERVLSVFKGVGVKPSVKRTLGGAVKTERRRGTASNRRAGYEDEWYSLPKSIRNAKSHYTLDQYVETVNETAPELRIEDDNDLRTYFERHAMIEEKSRTETYSLQDRLAELRAESRAERAAVKANEAARVQARREHREATLAQMARSRAAKATKAAKTAAKATRETTATPARRRKASVA